MKIVLDTNVLISGIFWKGTPRKILEMWYANQFRLLTSISIIEEYRRVAELLAKQYRNIEINPIIDLVVTNSEILSVPTRDGQICEDPDDDKFLECALAGGADFLVTGDKLLLKLNGYDGMAVVKPAAFLKAIGG